MEQIADDAVSDEHEEPLEHAGVNLDGEACRRGLDAASGSVSRAVPDLHILVRDALAIAWGLSRMVAAARS